MLRGLALVAAVLGGLCWVARWGMNLAGSDPAWGEDAHWAGLALLGVAMAAVGAGLVSSSAAWLRVIVAIAAPLLVWSVYAVLRGDRDGIMLDGVLGAVAVVGSLAMLLLGVGVGAGREESPRRGHGAHSAR